MSLRQKLYNPEDPKDAEELLNYLESIESDDECYEQFLNAESIEVALVPPSDGRDSDQDDAASDVEFVPTIRDLGKGLLSQEVEVFAINKEKEKTVMVMHPSQENTCSENSDESDNETLADKQKRLKLEKSKTKMRRTRKPKKWEEIELKTREQKIDLVEEETPTILTEIINKNLAPIDLFKMFFSESIIDKICLETKKYADQKGFHNFSVTPDDIYKYLAIILLSGYSPVPSRRSYWETRPDTNKALLTNSMSRNKFENIHRFFHLNDNSKIDKSDKIYKIRPLVNNMNKVSEECIRPLGKYFSIDEAMEPYYGRHGMKQFIRGKPIRFGFKFWCLCTFDGYLIKFDTYTGAGDKIEGKTLGSSVTEKMCVNFLQEKSVIFLDNFFTSISLLESLTENKLFCVGTIRSDRVEKAPLKDLKKEKRGSHYAIHETTHNISLTRWHDNSQVTIISNIQDEAIYKTKGSCKRWSKKEKSSVQLDQPSVINLYNKGMGGVDRFDQMRGLYRSKIRSKKWYWPLFRFCLDGSVVNMWYLYRRALQTRNETISLLEFRRRIVLAILSSVPSASNTGPKPKLLGNVLPEIRFDGKEHWIDKQETQRRCGKCGKCTKFSCLKCNVGLHPEACFRLYHQK